jgi:hypothetical protein
MQRVLKLMQDNIIVPFSGQIFPLEQVKEAVKASNETARQGKVLLKS